MTAGLKALGILGGGAILASVVASEPSNTQPVQYTPTSEVRERVVTPAVKPSAPEQETTATPVRISPTPNPMTVPTPAPAPKPVTNNCHPSYSGCLKMNAGDYDCAGGSGNGPNYTGPVQVYGSDPFGLDRDNDGWGCE